MLDMMQQAHNQATEAEFKKARLATSITQGNVVRYTHECIYKRLPVRPKSEDNDGTELIWKFEKRQINGATGIDSLIQNGTYYGYYDKDTQQVKRVSFNQPKQLI